MPCCWPGGGGDCPGPGAVQPTGPPPPGCADFIPMSSPSALAHPVEGRLGQVADADVRVVVATTGHVEDVGPLLRSDAGVEGQEEVAHCTAGVKAPGFKPLDPGH